MDELRLIGLDYGAATVGVACSDGLFLTAQPVTVIRRKHETKLRQTFQQIEAIVTNRKCNAIVLGLPKKLDNSFGDRAEKTTEFAADLERRTGLPVVLWDERFTTVEAHRVLGAAGLRQDQKDAVVDKLAATLILQSYMDYLTNNPEEKKALLERIKDRI